MTIVGNHAYHGLTVWYDAATLPAGAPSSEVFCFEERSVRDTRAAELRRLPTVVDVSVWDADPGYSLMTFYEPR